MKALLVLAGIAGLLLAVVALAVFGLGDAALFVPPPEAAAESFMRSLATHRYDRARSQLHRRLAARTGAEALRAWQARIEGAIGRVQDVRGEPGWQREGDAEAVALLKAARGRMRVTLRLARQGGLWRIARFDGSHEPAAALAP